MPYTDPAAKKAYDRARYLRLREEADYQAMMSAYRAANKARQKELTSAWYERIKDEWNQQRRLAYLEDPEPKKAAAKAYYHANRETPEYQAKVRAKYRRHMETGQVRKWAAAGRRRNRHKLNEAAKLRRARKRTTQVEAIDSNVVFARDNWICQLCYERTDPDSLFPRWRPTVDHIIPLSRGGSHTYANVQTAHWECNSRKGNRLLEEVAVDG